jgi:hypothetical protein
MDSIDKKTGLINVYKLLPDEGDGLMVWNCGTHFEVRYQKMMQVPPLLLTDQDIMDMQRGVIVWN